jgi:FkbM family methyltransferase
MAHAEPTVIPTSAKTLQPPMPVHIDEREAAQWSNARPLALSLAAAWARFAPRGKGWGARVIGRTIGKSMKATIRTASGGVVAVDPRNLDIYTTVICRNGVWEKIIHDTCKALARPGDVVFDIGANAGVVAMDLCAHLKGNLTLVGIEPIPSLAHNVALSARLSGFEKVVRVYEVMLGEREGDASLFIPRHAVHASAVSREADAVELKRRVCVLDQLVETGVIPGPQMIKIDVEGAELGVFKGALRMLAKYQPVIVFEADQNMTRFGYGRRQLVDLMSSAVQYRYFFITDHGFVPATDMDAPFTDDTTNMVAIPPGRDLPRFS